MVKKTIKPENNDGKCFQYAIYSALIYKQIKSHPKEYQKLRFLLISMIGKRKISYYIKILEKV